LNYLTKRLKTANLSKEQKTKIRREQNAIRKELRERIVPYGAEASSVKLGREFPAINTSELYSEREGLVQVEMLRQVEALKAQYRKLQEDEELEKVFLQGFNMEA